MRVTICALVYLGALAMRRLRLGERQFSENLDACRECDAGRDRDANSAFANADVPPAIGRSAVG